MIITIFIICILIGFGIITPELIEAVIAAIFGIPVFLIMLAVFNWFITIPVIILICFVF